VSDSPYALPGAGALALLLLGFGLYRYKGRSAAKERTDTSFLESRAQPDSFFGASGGQRIDTSDASAGSSSMGFSLSQLDAIGDVDPVAEADVYLAYGRDLQAEEILKEAMRANPDRLAVRTKLLEVYAKRRDTKGFELLAVQLYSLTKGTGPDWEKVQALGQTIDPENPLYKPGGQPLSALKDGDKPFVEPLSATTLPASTLPRSSEFSAPAPLADTSASRTLDLDLDLDLGVPPEPPVSSHETTRAMATDVMPSTVSSGVDFDVSTNEATDVHGVMDFNLDPLSLDLTPSDETTLPAPPKAAVAPASPRATAAGLASGPSSGFDFGKFDLSQPGDLGDTTISRAATLAPDDADPIARKLELAEEFRQIGDMEGARDLLEEVIGKSSGALKVKAQHMLDELG
jgi:pilus assembly protein FimV